MADAAAESVPPPPSLHEQMLSALASKDSAALKLLLSPGEAPSGEAAENGELLRLRAEVLARMGEYDVAIALLRAAPSGDFEEAIPERLRTHFSIRFNQLVELAKRFKTTHHTPKLSFPAPSYGPSQYGHFFQIQILASRKSCVRAFKNGQKSGGKVKIFCVPKTRQKWFIGAKGGKEALLRPFGVLLKIFFSLEIFRKIAEERPSEA